MLIQLILKTILIYFIILITMRFMGKREIGQLSLFDFVVLLLIADVAVVSIDETEDFFLYLIPIFILAIIQKILAIILLKFPNLRTFFDGKEAIIMYEGKLNIKEMKKQNYSIDDILPQIRLKNIKSLSEVRFMLLEPNGEVSIFKFDESSSSVAVPTDMSKADGVSKTGLAKATNIDDISIFPFIVSGKVLYDNLKLLDIKEEWLEKEIKKQGYQNYSDIYYANFEKGKLFIAETIELDN